MHGTQARHRCCVRLVGWVYLNMVLQCSNATSVASSVQSFCELARLLGMLCSVVHHTRKPLLPLLFLQASLQVEWLHAAQNKQPATVIVWEQHGAAYTAAWLHSPLYSHPSQPSIPPLSQTAQQC